MLRLSVAITVTSLTVVTDATPVVNPEGRLGVRLQSYGTLGGPCLRAMSQGQGGGGVRVGVGRGRSGSGSGLRRGWEWDSDAGAARARVREGLGCGWGSGAGGIRVRAWRAVDVASNNWEIRRQRTGGRTEET
ncbi:hypothetical protein GCM10018772_13310 [Streptomyces fumanus]|uniref:Uncharacterized protein n=1 Tax=Streptomyces fumanus TaxID=67302 RepID=A0A919A6N6_9ACTN|nr:hypothetical protein GCM10018772_13310 [Streptomyces fumanus]